MTPRKSRPSATRPPTKRGTKRRPPTRKPLVRVALAVSLDGYIADRRGGVEWLNPYFSPEMDFAGFMAAIGAAIMGRKTYDVARKLGMPPGSGDQRGVVMSRRALKGLPKGLERYDGTPAGLVSELRRSLAGSERD